MPWWARRINVYGDPSQLATLVVAPVELPGCDVLELDCEGAEIVILRDMTIRPRVVEEWGIAEPRLSEICETNDI
jgi:hypothetical protein